MSLNSTMKALADPTRRSILNYLKDVVDHFNENDELKVKQRRKQLKSV